MDTTPGETHIPSAAKESTESIAIAPTARPDVIAPAPTQDAPTAKTPAQDMAAEERALFYPRTPFSEELPAPQANPRRQTIFSDSPMLAPPIPTSGDDQSAYGKPSLPGNRQSQILGQPPLGPVPGQSHMPIHTPLTTGFHRPRQPSMQQARLDGNIQPFPTMMR